MKRTGGFTLVELMVSVAVIGLLASIAVPNYFRMIENVHRAEAKGLLNDLYGMENAFLSEYQRYGCLDEVGFQLEGKGHFAVWICDSGDGCFFDPATGGIRCPCLEAPDDWTGEGGDPFVLNDVDRSTRYAWMPVPAAGGPFLASGAPAWMSVPMLPFTLQQLGNMAGPPPPGSIPDPIVPQAPGGLAPPAGLIPADCAAVMQERVLTAGADNWCRRAIPTVVDIAWFTSANGKNVYLDPMEDDPQTLLDRCSDEPSSGAPQGGNGGGGGLGGPIGP